MNFIEQVKSPRAISGRQSCSIRLKDRDHDGSIDDDDDGVTRGNESKSAAFGLQGSMFRVCINTLQSLCGEANCC